MTQLSFERLWRKPENAPVHLPDWRDLPARHLRHRFGFSEHHARTIAELAFGDGGAS